MLMINAKNGYGNRTGQGSSLKHFKGAEVVDVDNSGHWVHHDQFDMFMKLVREFLDRVSA